MNFRLMTVAGLALALAGCTTVGPARNAVEARWKGQPAGVFFAAFGPPQSDVSSGDMTIYSWKGGYKKRTIPAQFAEGENGKKGKKTASARTEFLSCSVQLNVSSDYVIRSIQVLGDVKKSSGPSWCDEYLASDKAK